jgi:hypothetical protein
LNSKAGRSVLLCRWSGRPTLVKAFMNGWVKFHRTLIDSDLWLSEPFTKGQAFVDLFLNANHKGKSFWVRGIEIKVERGQIAWSEVTMANRWRWSRNKVRRFLKWLENDGKTIQQTIQRITTVITLVNYDKYQSDETTNETTERQQKDNKRYTNKNDKNDKNINTVGLTDLNDYLEWLKLFNETNHTKYKSQNLISNFSFWRKQYSQEEMLTAIGKIKDHSWLSDKAKPELILRQRDQSGNPVDRIGELLSTKGGKVYL